MSQEVSHQQLLEIITDLQERRKSLENDIKEMGKQIDAQYQNSISLGNQLLDETKGKSENTSEQLKVNYRH